MIAPVTFRLDGRDISALPGETILQAAERHGIAIPHLCYTEGMRADGNCRACVVEIKGERVLAASCCRQPTHGMEVASHSERALHSPEDGPRAAPRRYTSNSAQGRFRADAVGEAPEHW